MQQKTKAIKLKLDEPPSLNDLYKPVINRNTHQAYMILTPVGKRYKNYVYSVVAKEIRKEDEFISKNDRLEVYIHFYPKNPLRDLDNILKILLDSLQKAKVFVNDRCIVHLDLWKHKACDLNGFITVEIKQETEDY